MQSIKGLLVFYFVKTNHSNVSSVAFSAICRFLHLFFRKRERTHC